MSAATRSSAGATKSKTDQAIAHLVKMNPRRVTVTLPLPVEGVASRPSVTLEWTREDTQMPLSDLLKRLEEYAQEFAD